MKHTRLLSLGIDYGTDSARALLVDVHSGEEVAADVAPYPGWSKGDFCDAGRQQYRQHPRDYLEAMTKAVRGALKRAGRGAGEQVVGIGVDTTGSTPIAVDAQGTALALRPEFAKNPNA